MFYRTMIHVHYITLKLKSYFILQSVPPDSLVTTALPYVHILIMEFFVMKHVTVQIHPVIISMVAIQPHQVSPVGTMVLLLTINEGTKVDYYHG